MRELHGPANLSFEEVAGILSEALGKKVEFVRAERKQMRQALVSHGLSDNFADAMLEMYDAVDSGKLRSVRRVRRRRRRRPRWRTFARETMLPLLAEPAVR